MWEWQGHELIHEHFLEWDSVWSYLTEQFYSTYVQKVHNFNTSLFSHNEADLVISTDRYSSTNSNRCNIHTSFCKSMQKQLAAMRNIISVKTGPKVTKNVENQPEVWKHV